MKFIYFFNDNKKKIFILKYVLPINICAGEIINMNMYFFFCNMCIS